MSSKFKKKKTSTKTINNKIGRLFSDKQNYGKVYGIKILYIIISIYSLNDFNWFYMLKL